MSRTYSIPASGDPVDFDQLVGFFADAERPDPGDHLVGTELEKFGVVLGTPDDPRPLAATVSHAEHVAPVLDAMSREFGWAAGAEAGEGGALITLCRDRASITLEPGGQLELSGKPLHNVHETCAEFTRHHRELEQVSTPLGVAWLTAGYHPWATGDEMHWMPKGRYRVMRAYLPGRGRRALDMMTRTCTVQANFDFANEAQCGARYRLALALGPLVTAMFANSPYEEGRATGRPSNRTMTWFEVDPDRCGTPPFMFDGRPFSYEAYVDWALDVPMFFVKRGGAYHAHHVTFREYMHGGFDDPRGTHHRATWADWELHLSTLFPEARLKPYIEVRTADSVGSKYVCALPSLWKGVLYDQGASEAAWELVSGLARDELEALDREARVDGLRSTRVHGLCKRLIAIAREGLDRQDVRDGKGRTEARFLDPLQPLVDAGRSPGDDALDALGPEPGRSQAARLDFSRTFHFAGARTGLD